MKRLPVPVGRATEDGGRGPVKTTLCYVEHGGCFLMLLRNKKDHDLNEGKWVGVGGKFLPGETPDECLVREVREETGLELSSFERRGLVRFSSDEWGDEDMYLYTATLVFAETAAGDAPAAATDIAANEANEPTLPPVPECDEGTFAWVPVPRVLDLPLWTGDRYFLEPLIAGERDIRLSLRYVGERLVSVQRED